MTRAMLLCAGYGTRLGQIADQRPKPMLPVCDVPIVRYGIAMLREQGITDLVINLHHKSELIERELDDGKALGVNITYAREGDLLGTGGGLRNALPWLDPDGTDEPILSLNGKLIFDLDVSALLDEFSKVPDALGMMVVRRVPDAQRWGAVAVDHSGAYPRVLDILGQGDFMFTGVHVTRPSVVRQLPNGEACMVRQGYLPWLREGRPVAAYAADPRAYFAEHSTPQRYLRSNIDLLGDPSLRFPPAQLTGIDPAARIHDSAVIQEPVRIGPKAVISREARVGPNVVIGRGAVVQPRARISDSVVWAGTSALGVLERCIVTPRRVIEVDKKDFKRYQTDRSNI